MLDADELADVLCSFEPPCHRKNSKKTAHAGRARGIRTENTLTIRPAAGRDCAARAVWQAQPHARLSAR